MTLSWAAPASNGGLPVSGYIIYQGTSPGGETGAPVNGSPVTATSYTVTGLTNGTTYYFQVVAVNAAGLSPLSEEASATLPPSRRPRPAVQTPLVAGTAADAVQHGPPSSTATPSSTGSRRPAHRPGVPRTDRADRDRGRHPGPPVVDRAHVGRRVVGRQLQGLCRHRPRRAGERRASAPPRALTPPWPVWSNGTVYYFMVTAVDAAGNESPFSTEVSAEPTEPATRVTVGLDSPTAPKQLIALLAAVAAMAAAGVFTLITRRRRRSRSPGTLARARPGAFRPADGRGVGRAGRAGYLPAGRGERP